MLQSARCVGICALFTALSTPAAAQTQPAPRAASNGDQQRWEVEAYGGLSLGRWSGGGKVTLPGPGAPITTSSPVYPGWSVPSWFFGDGAAYLNNVAAELGVTGRLSPLDALLQPEGLNDAGNAIAGVRLRRTMRARWALELGVEVAAQPVSASRDLIDGLGATAATFQSTFGQILTTGPFSAPAVTAGSSMTSGSSRDVAVTVALNAPMRSFGSMGTYAVAGGAVIMPVGDPVVAQVTGRYRFSIAGVQPIDETDVLTVRYRDRITFAAVAGAGVRRPLSGRLALRIDGRFLYGPATTAIEVDAAPSVVSGTPAGYIESFTYPNLQFSNNASTGRRSTLGGPGLSGDRVFGGGWLLRGRLTAGVDIRF